MFTMSADPRLQNSPNFSTRTHPNPSSEVSNSTNAGVTADPCRRMSWGVVMDTRHLTRVRGTVLPSAERTRLRLMRYWPLSSAGVANTLSGPKPSMDVVMLSVGMNGDSLVRLTSRQLHQTRSFYFYRSPILHLIFTQSLHICPQTKVAEIAPCTLMAANEPCRITLGQTKTDSAVCSNSGCPCKKQ